MSSEEDPYKILGVPRTADLAQVRQAFREAALRLHPDQNRADPTEAEKRFRDLVTAYEVVLEEIDTATGQPPGKGQRTLTPQDIALLDARQYFSVVDGPETAGRGGPMGAWRHAFPTLDEPSLFIVFWLVALVLSLGGTWLLTTLLLSGKTIDTLSTWGWVMLVGAPLVIYAVMLACSLLLVTLTRKVVWMVFGFRWRRALPAPPKGPHLPTPLPSGKLPIR